MQVLLDQQKLLEITDFDCANKPIEKEFTSSFSLEEIFSYEKNEEDFKIKFYTEAGILGSIITKPKDLNVSNTGFIVVVIAEGSKYSISLLFKKRKNFFGTFSISKI